MMSLTLITAVAIAQAAAPAPARASEPALQVGIFGYQADGTVSVSAFGTELSQSSLVYMIGDRSMGGVRFRCGMGSGHTASERDANYAWRFSGRVIAITPDEAVIQLNWQRVMELGKPVTSPEGSVHLTLKRGDRVLLDSVPPQDTEQCWSSVGFEARYGTKPFEVVRIPRTVKDAPDPSSTGGTAPTGGGRVMAVPVDEAASQASVPAAGSAPPRPSAGGGGFMSGAAGRVVAMGALKHEIDLWLVRSAPGKPDESKYQRLRSSEDTVVFGFEPISIESRHGTAAVTVNGSVGILAAAAGEPRLQLSMRRVVSPSAGAHFPAGFSTSGTTHPLPGPGDVLSFEMPPVRIADENLPDRLSVRVRITRLP